MAPTHLKALDERIELDMKPEAVMKAIGAISDYERAEQDDV